jgi:3-isopropylmalate/(R)-2-methylmalate dehydratase small subunit
LAAAREDIARVAAAIDAQPAIPLVADVAGEALRFGDRSIRARIRPAARDALLNGRWDPIGELLEGLPAVRAAAGKLPYMVA